MYSLSEKGKKKREGIKRYFPVPRRGGGMGGSAALVNYGDARESSGKEATARTE